MTVCFKAVGRVVGKGWTAQLDWWLHRLQAGAVWS